MSIQNFSPRFIKAKVFFKLEGFAGNAAQDVGEHLINRNGVPGFKWDKFDAATTVGKSVDVYVFILSSKSFKISCPGTLTCELTERATSLGVILKLAPEQLLALDEVIAKEGILPDYVRKFPRIPFLRKLGHMPSYGIVHYNIGQEAVFSVCEVENVSPTGFSLTTEDQRSNCLGPGENVKVTFLPRGENFNPIDVVATLKRIIRGIDPISGNLHMTFGMSITGLNDENKVVFTHLLRKIIESMK